MHTEESILQSRDIKPTAMRILVLRTMAEMGSAVSLSDLEARLSTADKSTLFRTLTLFLAHHLVHCIDDGSGFTKYALCSSDCHCGEADDDGFSDHHTHFFCERCHRTFCLRGLPVPEVAVPMGFQLHSANYVLKGLCPSCSHCCR
ncbi:MAG: transcriptional repressor [Bacteroidaceae bacterium]|nr:transcriptional repressor [Bacteroidaceae bacterium]